MIRKAFLDSLVGLNIKEAESKVKAENLRVFAYANTLNVATAEAQPDLVILWISEEPSNLGQVTKATVGDPTELDTWKRKDSGTFGEF